MTLTRMLPLLGVAALVAGCASMKVDESRLVAPDTLERPSRIYVKTFEPGSSWTGDFGGRTKQAFIDYELDRLNSRLLIQLKEVAPTRLVPATLPSQGWLVTGRLKRVDAGHGAARFWAGMYGAGAREVEAEVMVYDLAKSKSNPMIQFPIDGGSRAEEGIMGAADNLDADWDRIARETRNLMLKRMR